MSKTQAPDPAHDLKAQALALCHALEEQPGSQYQTAAVLAAFKVYRAFESIEKHGEIRQWVFDVAAPSAMPAPSAAYLTKNGRLHVTAWECHGCGHRGIDDGDDANEACSDCDWRGPCPDEDVCPGCGREGTMVSACPKCGDRYYIKAEADLVIPTAIPAPEGAQLPPLPPPTVYSEQAEKYAHYCEDQMRYYGAACARAALAAPAPQAPVALTRGQVEELFADGLGFEPKGTIVREIVTEFCRVNGIPAPKEPTHDR